MSVTANNALAFTDEQAMILDTAREFCRSKSPIAAVRALLDTDLGYDPQVWREMVELGWLGISLPEACGGSGLGLAGVVPVVESMGRAMLGTPFIATTLAAQLLARSASAAQMERWLAAIIGGEVATIALLDNADWGDSHTRCTLDEAGVLTGSKHFVADAGAARLFVVPVTHRGEAALAVVEAGQLPAGAVREHVLIDQTRRAATVDFTGVAVGPENRVTGPRVAAALSDMQLLGALLVAAEATGSAGACLDTIVEYLKTRKQFGRLIGSYQALKHPAVEILNAVDSAKSFIYHAATLLVDGPVERDAEIATRMAKVQATETLCYAGDRAVQFHGGMGFTYECDAQLYIRRAQWSQQQFGDAQHHRKRLASLLLDNR